MFSNESSDGKQLQDFRSREMRNRVRNYKKQMKTLEYSRLRSLVPSTACRPRVSKIEVIEEAIKYIAFLQATLSSRLEESNENSNRQETEERTESERKPKILRQKRQRFASYMIKTQKQTVPARRKFSRQKTTESEQPR